MNITIKIPGKTNYQVTKLNLAGKNLNEFPQEVFKYPNLKKLIINNNHINKIPQQIIKLKKLQVLDISYNNIQQLHAGIFKLPKLHTLNVSNNKIKSLPPQLKFSNIKNLLIQHNNIESINEDHIKGLKKLNISHNKITELHLSHHIFNLHYLWINHNPIKNLILQKEKLPYLYHLYTYKIDTTSHLNTQYENNTLIKKSSCKDSLINNIATIKEHSPQEEKKQIFISYAHADGKWLNLLKKHLNVLNKAISDFDYWDDTRIKTGKNWKEEISNSLSKAQIAILLVSTNFLASDFIQNNELPKLLQKAEIEGTKILSVIISPCRFTKTKDISKFQAVNSPDKTLLECTEAEKERFMLKLMDDIEDYIGENA